MEVEADGEWRRQLAAGGGHQRAVSRDMVDGRDEQRRRMAGVVSGGGNYTSQL